MNSAPSNRRIGFIGLGLMGRPMAVNLLRAGLRLVVHNRSQEAVREFVALGAEAARSPGEVAEKIGAGISILMLTDTAAVRSVVEGPDGFIGSAPFGSLVIDMGSTGVEETCLWSASCARRGSAWLDAPVSGGQAGAIDGNLTIMAGGEKGSFVRSEPVLRLLGSTITHIGRSGAGQAAKLANQIIVANTLASVAEAFTLAKAAGADLVAVRRALLGGFAASRILDIHGQRMIDGNFVPGGRATGQLKDVREASKLAQSCELVLPLLQANLELWQRMIDAGMGGLDHSALIKLYEKKREGKMTGEAK
jgi:3-hydroxyisobutyrate dehydrogenase-like beta-hydroxyacid dehydrogenase